MTWVQGGEVRERRERGIAEVVSETVWGVVNAVSLFLSSLWDPQAAATQQQRPQVRQQAAFPGGYSRPQRGPLHGSRIHTLQQSQAVNPPASG